MPRICTICSHPDRATIDAALAAGDPLRNVAKRCFVTASALFRHKRDHLPGHLVKAAEEEDLAQAIDVVRQLKAINAACLEILQKSRADGKHLISLRAVDRIHKQIELQARLLGELQESGPQVNVLVAAEWHEIRVQVFQALEPFPEARAAVAAALQALLQTRRLHLPNNLEASALAEELLNYEIRVDENANDRYGAFRVGTHDDLVTALGLAAQVDHPTGSSLWDIAGAWGPVKDLLS